MKSKNNQTDGPHEVGGEAADSQNEVIREPSLAKSDFVDAATVSLTFVRELVRDSDEGKKKIVNNIVEALSSKLDAECIFLQLEVAFYFDNIGEAYEAVTIAQRAVDLANLLPDINLQRKAHNTVGILYSRICDYEKACSHLEKALTLAVKIENKCFEFAVLCNVVSTLQVMGLVSEAKNLSMKLSERPGGTQESDYLHLQNAINGLRLSCYARDVGSANYFNNIAREKLKSAGSVSSNWKAYIDAYYALSLLQQGQPRFAYAVINDAIQQRAFIENPRISAILYCAFGLCALENQDKLKIAESRKILAGLLQSSKSYALDHEDVLRTLVKLHEFDRSLRGRKAGLFYLRQLNDHLVNVKHKQFFNRISSEAAHSFRSQESIDRPSYSLPKSLAVAALDESHQTKSARRLYASYNDHVRNKGLRFVPASRRKLEEPFRSDDFNVAEDWAVAADFAADRQDGHCFEVGGLARLLALQLGFSANRSMLVEMACRLHDIGKLAVDAELQRSVNIGLLDTYFSTVEHSTAGARLLGSSSDVVLQLATHVARHHHEWWNGCGLPNGLVGENIPIEARICSIADAYLVLLSPSEPQSPWDWDAALQQVVSMAGVQLDPNLMGHFLTAVEVYNTENAGEDDRRIPRRLNSLIVAKQQLLNAVKLIS